MDRDDVLLVVTVWHFEIGQTALEDPLCRVLTRVTAKLEKETNTVINFSVSSDSNGHRIKDDPVKRTKGIILFLSSDCAYKILSKHFILV